ncbi:MAG: DsrH/TusB family sulfur metabolism protein [Candidatus Hodarchaeales archaeon]|jgi:sulfur relay (sulfurtransferase) DsrF/TusC family protein
MEKNILVILTRTPIGRIHVEEGMRIAVGLTLEDHEAQLLFTGNSVFAARKEFKNRLCKTYMEELEYIYVDEDALKVNGITEKELRTDVKVIDTSGIVELVEKAEFILTF